MPKGRYLERVVSGILRPLGEPYVGPSLLQSPYYGVDRDSRGRVPDHRIQLHRGPYNPRIDAKSPSHHRTYTGHKPDHHRPPKNKAPITVYSSSGTRMTFPPAVRPSRVLRSQ